MIGRVALGSFSLALYCKYLKELPRGNFGDGKGTTLHKTV